MANGLLTLLLSILGHLEKLQRRVFDLVSNAYTSIRADDLASLMGVSTDAAVSGKFINSLITVSYKRTNFMCSIQDLEELCGWHWSSCPVKPIFAQTKHVLGQTITNIYYDACISIILNFWSIRSVKDWTKSSVIQRFDRTLSVVQPLFQA